jgi:hypothetical protein
MATIVGNLLRKVLVVPTIVERIQNPTTRTSSNVANVLLDPLNIFRRQKESIDKSVAAKKIAQSNVTAAAADETTTNVLGLTIPKILLYPIIILIGIILFFIIKPKKHA